VVDPGYSATLRCHLRDGTSSAAMGERDLTAERVESGLVVVSVSAAMRLAPSVSLVATGLKNNRTVELQRGPMSDQRALSRSHRRKDSLMFDRAG
jgi:hypothetical protein